MRLELLVAGMGERHRVIGGVGRKELRRAWVALKGTRAFAKHVALRSKERRIEEGRRGAKMGC